MMSSLTTSPIDEIRAAKKAVRHSVKDQLKLLSEQAMALESEFRCGIPSNRHCVMWHGAVLYKGAKICYHVLSSKLFSGATRVGIYVHCARLREVDTGKILSTALASGRNSAHEVMVLSIWVCRISDVIFLSFLREARLRSGGGGQRIQHEAAAFRWATTHLTHGIQTSAH